jgi:hypothetical protein
MIQEQLTFLLFLKMADVFDVVADAVEPFAGDGSEDPAPFCAVCGGDIGVFLKFGAGVAALPRYRPRRPGAVRAGAQARPGLALPGVARVADGRRRPGGTWIPRAALRAGRQRWVSPRIPAAASVSMAASARSDRRVMSCSPTLSG